MPDPTPPQMDQPSDTPDAAAVPDQAPAPPARRGRRKATATPTAETSVETDAPSAPSSSGATPTPDAPAAKTKRRKVATAAASAEVTETTAPTSPASTKAEDNAKPKSRRKTQVKKTAAAADVSVAAPEAPAEPVTPAPEPTPAELQAELSEQVEDMVERIRETNPDYSPPPMTMRGLIEMTQRGLGRLVPVSMLQRAAASVGAQDLLNTDTWKGMWYMLNYTAQYQRDVVQRRLRGEYTTDAYGYDQEFQEIFKPLLDFLYTKYWRVTVHGIEHVPSEGHAFLMANHSGILPWDAAMIGLAVQRENPSGRMVRGLYASWLPNIPFVSLLLTKLGMVAAQPDNARRLLREGELVLGFPEEQRGLSKLFKDRYRLGRFVRRDMIQAAIETGAPLMPVTVIGSEEIYPVIGQSEGLGKMLGLPAFPVTPLWPWTGLLGVLPLPSKWTITFDAPINTATYGSEAASNPAIVTQLTDEVRAKIQGQLYDRLKDRKSIFFG